MLTQILSICREGKLVLAPTRHFSGEFSVEYSPSKHQRFSLFLREQASMLVVAGIRRKPGDFPPIFHTALSPTYGLSTVLRVFLPFTSVGKTRGQGIVRVVVVNILIFWKIIKFLKGVKEIGLLYVCILEV